MRRSRSLIRIAACLALGVLLAACATPTPGEEVMTSPLAQPVVVSILPTPSPLPSATPTALPTATPPPSDLRLVVLHTNDNWGETEPCG